MGVGNNIYYGKITKETIIELSKLHKISPEFMIIYNDIQTQNQNINDVICYEQLANPILKWEDFIDGLYNTK